MNWSSPDPHNELLVSSEKENKAKESLVKAFEYHSNLITITDIYD